MKRKFKHKPFNYSSLNEDKKKDKFHNWLKECNKIYKKEFPDNELKYLESGELWDKEYYIILDSSTDEMPEFNEYSIVYAFVSKKNLRIYKADNRNIPLENSGSILDENNGLCNLTPYGIK